MKKPAQILLCLLVFSFSLTLGAYADITPSQVLVLYNADWKDDHPLTEKGQDSKEIAEHYVKVNTDAATGEKPYILGLSGKTGQSLGIEHLEEGSKDNRSGVILTHVSKMVGSTHTLRDNRLIEFKLPKNEAGWDFDTLKMQIGPAASKLPDRHVIIENGKNLFPDKIVLQESDNFNVRLNGQGFLTGSLIVNASCTDKTGKAHHWEADYKNITDISFSPTGPDNVRDDKNYLDLIETPIKAFLEDPKNALKDGTLLKDHVLFFVICYGLPRTCIATYGIERGITNSPNNFGSIIDLGQRLQLMYYHFDQVVGSTPRAYKFDTQEVFSAFFFRAPQAFPLYGPKANPFLHPEIYSNDKTIKDPAKALPFNVINRQKDAFRHLYFAMRLDGEDPVQAKALIDRSIYARKYATPEMGLGLYQAKSNNNSMGKHIQSYPAGKLYWEAGYRRIFYKPASSNRLELFKLPPEPPFFNKTSVYLPGGIGVTAVSESGWNRKDSSLYSYLRAGVSMTASAANVYSGSPHIHNKSFWDDNVFYPALLKEKSIGEALVMNQIHLEWITCFVGDPLLKFPQENQKDSEQMQSEKIDIKFIGLTGNYGNDETVVIANLETNNKSPLIAQMRALALKAQDELVYSCDTFSSNPYIILKNSIIKKNKEWVLSFIDPFGKVIVKQVDIMNFIE